MKHSIAAAFTARSAAHELSEPELIAWAEQTAVGSAIDRWSGYGAVVFWVLVVSLVTARIFFFDASNLKPSGAITSDQSRVQQLTQNPSAPRL